MNQKLSKFRMLVAIVLSMTALTLGQMIQKEFQDTINGITGLYGWGNLISAIIYIVIVCLLLKLICMYILKCSMSQCRIGKPHFELKWIIVAILLPLLVSGIMMCLPGSLESNHIDPSNNFYIITEMIF